MYIDVYIYLDFFNEKIDDVIYEINNFRILIIVNGMDVESYL